MPGWYTPMPAGVPPATLHDRWPDPGVWRCSSSPGAGAGDWDVASKSLVDDLEKAEFTYYGIPARDMPRGWYSRWEGVERLPDLVRIRVASQAAGEWPELMVHLNVDGTRYLREAGFAQ